MNSIFILSKKVVFEQLKKLKPICDEISYSLKTNHSVGKLLEEVDCSFSIHSMEDTNLVAEKNRIWFFAQAWSSDNIDSLVKKDIKQFVVDNEKDLITLTDFLEKNEVKVNLLLRMRLKEHTVHTGKHFVFGMFSTQINSLIPKLHNNPNISKLGIHVHRKTQNLSEWSLKEEISDSLTPETISNIDVINIGGGLPSVYKNFNINVYDSIFKRIANLHNWLKEKKIHMIIEPGRFIAAPSTILKTKILSIYNNTLVVDASVFNSAMDTFIANIKLLVEGEIDKGTPYTIKGCTPDSMDIFRYQVFLEQPRIGDYIVFKNAGAYNFQCDFCNLPKIKTVIE